MTHHYDTDFEFMTAVGEAYKGVKTITGEESHLIFSDTELALKAADELETTNPLDVLGFKPFEYSQIEGVYVEMPKDEFYGGDKSRTFHKALKRDVNLYTLLATIEEGFETTLDYHHTFFEGYEATHQLHPFEGPVMIVRPILGS